IKSDIKKATSRFSVNVDLNGSLEDFISLSNKTFARQNLKPPYSDELLEKLDKVCEEKECRKILIAKDSDGAPHAGAFLVWDRESAYYLIGGGDPSLRKSGATSLCLWEAIKFSASVTKSFDFEGSMIQPIEKFFRAFGGTPTPYFYVTKTSSKMLKLKKFLLDIR
ncbi:MAG: GNAT family N-acetyltransferase, partial [Bdellovibrio sp.]|nr:GNAT family N-acetyltransferase [Bdellovibrio sp.]